MNLNLAFLVVAGNEFKVHSYWIRLCYVCPVSAAVDVNNEQNDELNYSAKILKNHTFMSRANNTF